MIDISQIRQEIELRNRLRKEAGLPGLLIEEELRKVLEAREREAFEEFFLNSPVRKIMEDKFLQRIRRSQKDPNWRPTGILSGGGLAFYSAVRSRMWQVWCSEQGRLKYGKAHNE